MARKVLVRLVDDLDGSPSADVAPVTFALDGVTYQIDLNQRNAGRLRESLSAFVASARRTSGRAKRGTAIRAGSGAATGDVSAIREWAKEQGLPVSARGRIPANILDAYNSAGGSTPVESAPRASRTKTAAAAKSAPTATAPAKRGRPATKPAAAKSAPRAERTTATKSAAAAKSAAGKATGRTTRTAAAKPTATKTAAKTAATKTTAAKTTAKAAPKTTAKAAAARTTTRSTRSAASKPAAKTAARSAKASSTPAPRRAVARKARG
jgi:hypothetical protein